ncbi:hypothetical protein G6046_04970, partial [Bacillus amyloliquefaciens]|nr:hypothetical protein [Bacillus amyloliquefaciens]
MGQIANLINQRPPGTLPSNVEINPKETGKEHEQAKAVQLRSGRELKEKIPYEIEKEI